MKERRTKQQPFRLLVWMLYHDYDFLKRTPILINDPYLERCVKEGSLDLLANQPVKNTTELDSKTLISVLGLLGTSRIDVRLGPLARLFRVSNHRIREYLEWLALYGYLRDLKFSYGRATFIIRSPRVPATTGNPPAVKSDA